MQAVDPHVTLTAVPCPTLAPIIQAGAQFDERVVQSVREACAPLKAAEVDTVILGCTHYPLIAPMLQRMLGPGVTLITSGAALARQVEHALSTRDLLNIRGAGDEGDYSFLCTGDVETFQGAEHALSADAARAGRAGAAGGGGGGGVSGARSYDHTSDGPRPEAIA